MHVLLFLRIILNNQLSVAFSELIQMIRICSIVHRTTFAQKQVCCGCKLERHLLHGAKRQDTS